MFITYSHHGDLGDTLYALPTIASLTGGDLLLYPAPGKVREPYTPEKVERVRSLFACQRYIGSVRYAREPEGVILDDWRRRRHNPRRTLADCVADTFRVQPWGNHPWLTVDPNPVAEVVIHRSPRYHSRDFPWRELVGKIGGRAVFVGSPEEHAAFQFGNLPHYPTPTLLDLARVIAGARLFIGNQSTPRAIAEGLKRPVYVEEDSRCPNTHFVRPDAFYGRNDFGRVDPLLSDIVS